MFALPADALVALAALVIGGLVVAALVMARALERAGDHERSQALSRLAYDAAATALALHPKSTGLRELARIVVQILSSTRGLPTRNAAALERAAYGALAALGRKDAV